ncbi:Rpn family recombination-promoting nuclease/putative transposase [Salmonella enterica]|nr:Rpn family recombination-promoting nuclease/putative transposase [Salmonella enterica subsp. enterica serovar Abaetetuba]EFP1215441.1 Rpn family recombination-promoting nuclease/putative transposase [Salmonella enterica]
MTDGTPHVGIDEWAWHRGHRYGTLIVNLDTHRPLVLLPGRDQRTLAAWFRKYPEIQVVSRDRGGIYATAAREGAPQTRQVADRWHLLKNIGDALERMMYRQMRYAIAAMQRHLEAGHGRLPLVIPLQFYHGERSPYPYSTNWLDCFSNPEVAGKIYTNPFPLVDVTVIDDDDIMCHRRMAALTLLMKHIRQRDLMELLDKLPLLMVEMVSDEQVRVLIHYMVNAGDSPSPEFMRALAARLPQHEDKLMTIAERLEQKGREEGRKEGLQEGRQEGAAEKAQAIARQLRNMGMTPEQIKQATGLSDAELKKVIH